MGDEARPAAGGSAARTGSEVKALLELAERQCGVLSRSQMLATGATSRRIEWWLATGRLRRLHQGVYATGAAPARLEREMAALLACGGGAALSHQTAAALWQVWPQAAGSRVDVSVPRGRCRSVAGVRLHRVRLHDAQVMPLGPLRVTSPARTLLDLSMCLTPVELERALAHAMRERLVNASRMRQFLRIHARRAGSRVLRVLLDSGPAFTRSEAESRFLDLVRRAELPAPAVNVRVSGCEVDFMWRRARLVVEIDGFAWHAHRDAFERDRRRDANLIAEGITVMRVTWRQLMDEPFAVVARVARVLATAAGSSAPSR